MSDREQDGAVPATATNAPQTVADGDAESVDFMTLVDDPLDPPSPGASGEPVDDGSPRRRARKQPDPATKTMVADLEAEQRVLVARIEKLEHENARLREALGKTTGGARP